VQIDEQGLRGIDGTLPVKFLHCVSIWDYGTYKWNLHMMHEPAQKRQKTETAHNLHMMHDDELDQIPIADDAELVADQIDIADDAELAAPPFLMIFVMVRRSILNQFFRSTTP